MEVKVEVMRYAQDNTIHQQDYCPRAKRVYFHERSELTSILTSFFNSQKFLKI